MPGKKRNVSGVRFHKTYSVITVELSTAVCLA